MAKIADLKPDPRNARKRTDRSASLIRESLERFGAARSIVIDEEGRILAGNGTVEGAKAAGIEKVRIIETEGDEIVAVRRTGLTEEQKIGLALADNRTSDLSEWDGLMLQQLSETHDVSPWFEPEDLEAIVGGLPPEDSEASDIPDDGTRTEEEDEQDEEEGERSDGSLLALVDIAIDEPKHQVENGDIWKVGPHLLFICSVMTDWEVWAKYLNSEDVIFCPYPGPFVPLGEKADDHVLVMVQPDRYVAGHLLDRYAEIKGQDTIKKAGAA